MAESPIKQIVFITHYAKLYGANRSLIPLIEHAMNYGFSPVVVLPEQGDLTAWLEREGIPFYQARMLSGFHKPDYRGGRWYHRLWQAYQSSKSLDARLSDDQQEAARIASALEHAEWVYTNSSVVYFGHWLSLALKAKHAWHFREYPQLHYGYVPDGGEGLFLNYVSASSVRICVSSYIQKQLLHDNEGQDSVVVHNGVVDEEDIMECNHPDSISRFLVIGRLAKSKGYLKILEAISTLKQLKFQVHFFGEGDASDVEQFQKRVKEMGLEDHVLRTPFTSDIRKMYSQGEAVIFLSQGEGFGRVIAEAMAFGKLVIAANDGGPATLIDHERDGFLLNNPHEELPAYIKACITGKPDIGTVLANARMKAKQHFTHNRYVEAVFHELNSH